MNSRKQLLKEVIEYLESKPILNDEEESLLNRAIELTRD